MHENDGFRYQVPTYMNTLMCPLNLVGWQGPQVIEHTNALVGTVTNASLKLTADQRGSIEFILVFLHYLLHLNLSGRNPCLY